MLEVTGAARINVKPDVGVLKIHVSQISPEMGEAIEGLGEKTNAYVKTLAKLGFKEEEIRTSSFEVDKNWEYRDNERVDSGYVASQSIRLEFPYNQKVLSDFLSEFSKKKEEASFGFSFKLSDALKEKVQDQIIKDAVKDATHKARNMAAAAGIQLIKIQQMTYGGWSRESGMQEVERESVYMAADAAYREPGFNFVPDDLLFRDTVTIHWLVK